MGDSRPGVSIFFTDLKTRGMNKWHGNPTSGYNDSWKFPSSSHVGMTSSFLQQKPYNQAPARHQPEALAENDDDAYDLFDLDEETLRQIDMNVDEVEALSQVPHHAAELPMDVQPGAYPPVSQPLQVNAPEPQSANLMYELGKVS